MLSENDNKLYITNPKNNGKAPIKLATTERSDTKRFNNAYQNANNDSTSYNEQPEQIEQPNDLIGEIPTEPYEDFNGSDGINKNTLTENQNNAPTDGNKNEQPENQNNAPTDGSKNKQPESRNNISSCDNFCIIIPNFGNNDSRENKGEDSNEAENANPNLPENADNDADTGETPLPQAESLPQDVTKTDDDWNVPPANQSNNQEQLAQQNGTGSGALGINLVAMAGIGIEADISINSDGSVTVAGGLLAGPAVAIGASVYGEGSYGQGSKDGIHGAACATGNYSGFSGTGCAGFSSNGGFYASGNISKGVKVGAGVYGKIGIARTFNQPSNQQKGN